MPENFEHALSAMVRKLSLHGPLSREDRAAIIGLPFQRRRLNPGQYVAWDGDRAEYSSVLLAGFAYRNKVAGNGGRQIVSVHMKGDLIDLQNSMLGIADHNVQMLSYGEVAVIPAAAIRELAAASPAIGMALWYETLVEGSIFREWLLNIGRRDARSRLAHLLCEFAQRLETAGLGSATAYELPMSQEQLADAIGLTPVHVNRTLMRLEAEGLVHRNKRIVTIPDWQKLVRVADFDPRYLHIPSGVLAMGESPGLYSAFAQSAWSPVPLRSAE